MLLEDYTYIVYYHDIIVSPKHNISSRYITNKKPRDFNILVTDFINLVKTRGLELRNGKFVK